MLIPFNLVSCAVTVVLPCLGIFDKVALASVARTVSFDVRAIRASECFRFVNFLPLSPQVDSVVKN